jgi:hypothetical protein
MPAGTGVDILIVSARKLSMGALEQRLSTGSFIFPTGRFAGCPLPIFRVSRPERAPAGEHSRLLIVLDSIASILFPAALMRGCLSIPISPFLLSVSVMPLHF